MFYGAINNDDSPVVRRLADAEERQRSNAAIYEASSLAETANMRIRDVETELGILHDRIDKNEKRIEQLTKQIKQIKTKR